MSASSNKPALKQMPPIEPISLVATPIAPAPAPGMTSSKAAIKHCCAAWQRAAKAYAQQHHVSVEGVYGSKKAGGRAYRDALPALSGIDGIRDFIACAAQGVLMGAIPPKKSGQLLYAAQVALNFQPRPPQSTFK